MLQYFSKEQYLWEMGSKKQKENVDKNSRN